ncbi:MAG: hypothetical protein ACLFVJ_16795 [Persicimonas sp.]
MRGLRICGLVALWAVFGMFGCSDDGGGEANNGEPDAGVEGDVGPSTDAEEEVWQSPEPEVRGMSISPIEITVAEADDGDGMMDQVAIFIENFQGAIDDVDVFVETPDGEVSARKQDVVATPTQIELVNVRKRWFRGLDPGEYDVGATVESDAGESVTEWGLATITIVEE